MSTRSWSWPGNCSLSISMKTGHLHLNLLLYLTVNKTKENSAMIKISIAFSISIVIVLSFCVKSEATSGVFEDDVAFEMDNGTRSAVILGVRYVMQLVMYGALTASIVCVFFIERTIDVSIAHKVSRHAVVT